MVTVLVTGRGLLGPLAHKQLRRAEILCVVLDNLSRSSRAGPQRGPDRRRHFGSGGRTPHPRRAPRERGHAWARREGPASPGLEGAQFDSLDIIVETTRGGTARGRM